MAVINYSSFAQALEKGMNRRNMTGMAKVLFDFMCNHEDVVHKRITKADIESGNTDKHYHVPEKESIEWFKGKHDVAETLKDGVGDNSIIAEAPKYFDENVLVGLLNPQKVEQAVNAIKELVISDETLDDNLRQIWLEECENGDEGAFLAHVFLYAVPQPNNLSQMDEEIIEPQLDPEDEKEIKMYESLLRKLGKPQADTPPFEIADKELEYVRQLLLAYSDAECVPCIDRSDLESNPKYKKYKNNFERSRQDFYCAEKIRESSKEILKLDEKDGFDIAKEEVFSGVVDVWELYESSNGFERMLQVLSKATNVNLSENTRRRLLNWIGNSEKKGFCHILVSENKLWWVEDAERDAEII